MEEKNMSFLVIPKSLTIWKKKSWQNRIGPFNLTLKWPRYFYSRWCPGGPWNPLRKPLSHREFCNEICTIYVRARKNHNSAKRILKCCTVSKWGPNNRFLFRVISILAKFWKNHFPKGIFQWNLAQRRRIWIDLHHWNNLFF